MDTHALTNILLFFTLFFGIISVLQALANRFNFPYTVLLLVAGFLSQGIVHYFNVQSHFHLEPQIIYYILLPLLLFEAAMHINLHQFRLQFFRPQDGLGMQTLMDFLTQAFIGHS